MDFVIKDNKKLRVGITTGSCATATAKASAIMLLSNQYLKSISFKIKNGSTLTLGIFDINHKRDYVSCSVVKDAGDDPDVTNGIKITATVSKIKSGIIIDGGDGVGRVTKLGLKIPIGHAAINAVPLEMIRSEVSEIMKQHGYSGGLKVVISASDGASIAKRTMNERLGIVGGISILGTTGIVEPMSDRAIIDTIKAEIDVNLSNGKRDLIITPGNYGREFAKTNLNIDIEDAIKCSNFIGDTLDYAVFSKVERITLIGHAGKMVKLAGGIMNTHSKVADCRMEIIAAHSALIGAPSHTIQSIMDCITVDGAIDIVKQCSFHKEVWDSIGKKIGFHLKERTMGMIHIKLIVFTQEHGILIQSEIGGN